MSLIRRKKAQSARQIELPEELQLLTLKEAAEMLRLDESTVRKGRARTASLTKVRQGSGKRRRVFLIRSEVEQHLRQLINEARERNPEGRALKVIYGAGT